ncbi:cell division inhibitor SepF [Desulfohalotomaculum tongense]|uniref:cell division protein SepF n=1 Tax=Desulforadius tongensis TaxID=1216062 RepID=UPI00195AD77E|nr:cell division protein SepF [Desulforadius tongensis]MBM7855241.1 cell division inhibitor SepF [Desulforadius tongensis]
MGKKFLDKMMGIMGFDDEEDIYDDEEQLEENFQEDTKAARRKGTVVSLHTQRQVQVVLAEPSSYDEVQDIADNLKNHRPVIVNLENAETDLARRVIDFMSGTTYALNGNMQKVGKNIFLFVPNNIDIASELKEKVREKGIFSIFQS